MAKFDLHLHSSYSDGSASVRELVNIVVNSGIKIYSLTDHDTVQGLNEAEKYTPCDIAFIKGIELTCKLRGINCHILGYGINPESNALTELIKLGKRLRREKLEARIKYLKDVWNIELNSEELEWLFSRNSVVKTHIANILVKRGLSDNNIDAMKKYLDGCKTGNTKFDGETAIKTIIASGGIPVWAHPLGGEGEKHISQEEFLTQLQTMIECGIKGLECYYSRYSMQEVEFLTKCAEEKALLISGGSDWHGTNKTVKIASLNSDGVYIDSKDATILNYT